MSDLFDAIKRGDEKSVASLLDSDPSLLTATESGVSPILWAVYHGHTGLARAIAKRGAALSFGEACALGEFERVRELLKGDPSLLHSRTADGYPAFGLAIFFRQPEVARYLIERGANVNAQATNAQKVCPVHAAVAVGDRETMKMLLERGADANARQQMDYTALHGAAVHGDIEMGRILLAHGADPKAKEEGGMTPADLAEKAGQRAFADWLRTVT